MDRNEDVDRDEEVMARLLRLAGPRSPIPPDIEARVYARVQDDWRASTTAPDSSRVYARVRHEWTKQSKPGRYRRWALPLAFAASLIVAIALVTPSAPPATDAVAIGRIARVIGNGDGLPAMEETVYAGQILATGPGQGLSLLLGSAESLRLDEQSTLVVHGPDEFSLQSGRVYADSGDYIYRDGGLVIKTAMGSVTDVGTQFAVAIEDDVIDVAVREGRVDVRRESAQFVAVAGERLRIRRDGGSSVDMIATHDAYWDWATSMAPVFDIENKSVLDFLQWAARETGRKLVFETDERRMAAMRADLHGSVEDFAPLEAVDSILATTSFDYRIEADSIVIE